MENNFSNNLKYLRIQNNMTQEELGKKLGKDYSTIGKWENGSRSPIMEDVIKISQIFDISLENLIGDFLGKDLTTDNINFDELELLFNKNKDILSDDDKETIKFVIEKAKRKVDEQLGEDK